MFIDELCWKETEPAKHDKTCMLKLDSEEWENIDVFLGLLAVCLLYALIQYMKQIY